MAKKNQAQPEDKSITLSDEVRSEAEKFVFQSSQFDSVQEFVDFVMAAVLGLEQSHPFNPEDEQVRRRLKDLGYL